MMEFANFRTTKCVANKGISLPSLDPRFVHVLIFEDLGLFLNVIIDELNFPSGINEVFFISFHFFISLSSFITTLQCFVLFFATHL